MKKFFAVLLLGILCACSSSGGTIGGIWPAPKLIKGSITGITYSVKLQNGTHISFPLPQGMKSEVTYMKIHEDIKPDSIFLSLGPAAMDFSKYDILTQDMRIPSPAFLPYPSTLEQHNQALFNKMLTEVTQQTGAAPQIIQQKHFSIGDKSDVLYTAYKFTYADKKIYLATYITKHNNHIIFVGYFPYMPKIDKLDVFESRLIAVNETFLNQTIAGFIVE